MSESDGTGATIREYVWLADLPLAQIEAAGAVYYVHADHLNTPLKMTDATQVLVWERQQEPFGETVAKSGTAASSLRFPGQFADLESGLNYNLMRDYDPTLGRYIEADPLGQLGGLNLYGYANQNPALYTDPRGEMSIAARGCAKIPACAAAMGATGLATAQALQEFIKGHPSSSPSDDAKNQTGTVWNDICAAPNAGSNQPEDEGQRCRRVVLECREKCLDVFQAGRPLPGVGSDTKGRLRRCVRECAESLGCYNY